MPSTRRPLWIQAWQRPTDIFCTLPTTAEQDPSIPSTRQCVCAQRLTHSLEVASLGKSLGDDVARKLIEKHPTLRGTLFEEIGTIVQTACYAHDMGNPPFGHSGEKAMQAFFTEGPGASLKNRVSPHFWEDITHFEGNANAFRLLTHRFLGRREGGFVMTYTTLASIVKYPFSSTYAGKHGKFGFFATEEDTYKRIADELGIIQKDSSEAGICYVRHPLTYLMEAADDICYEIMDIEDSHKLKLLSFEETADLLLGFFDKETRKSIRKAHRRRGCDRPKRTSCLLPCLCCRTIGGWMCQCLCRTRRGDTQWNLRRSLIKHISELPRQAYKHCTEVSVDRIYRSKAVLALSYQAIRLWKHWWKLSLVLPLSLNTSTVSSLSEASQASMTSKVLALKHVSCSTRLHQWNDRYLCPRYLSEDKWYQFATDIKSLPRPLRREGRQKRKKRGV